MPRQTGKIVIDTAHLERDTRRLTVALESGGKEEAHQQALRTAERIRAQTPIRTGALRSTITVTSCWVDATRRSPGGNGWGVTYGGPGKAWRYGWVINARQRNVKKGARGCKTEFLRALDQLTAREVQRI